MLTANGMLYAPCAMLYALCSMRHALCFFNSPVLSALCIHDKQTPWPKIGLIEYLPGIFGKYHFLRGPERRVK
jgi:hypothetical protein